MNLTRKVLFVAVSLCIGLATAPVWAQVTFSHSKISKEIKFIIPFAVPLIKSAGEQSIKNALVNTHYYRNTISKPFLDAWKNKNLNFKDKLFLMDLCLSDADYIVKKRSGVLLQWVPGIYDNLRNDIDHLRLLIKSGRSSKIREAVLIMNEVDMAFLDFESELKT